MNPRAHPWPPSGRPGMEWPANLKPAEPNPRSQSQETAVPDNRSHQSSIGQRIDAGTLADIIGSFETGRGNLGSDQHQFDAYRHFDSAPNSSTVCDRANTAWSRFYVSIRDSVQPKNPPEYDQIDGVVDARSSFGALTHSLHDFYAHSNWIELYVGMGQSPPVAASLFPNCLAGTLPPGLQTGFFDIVHGLDGCPKNGGTLAPPPGFTYCHETLNKDSNQTHHGRDRVPGSNATYHLIGKLPQP